MSRRPEKLAARYVAWVKHRALAIVFGHLLLLGGAIYLVLNHLPLYADFSYLLPQDAPAVVDLRKLEARVKAGDFILAVIDAPTPEARAAVHRELAEGIRALPADLVERVEADDAELRAFFKAHRHLFVPLADLELARDTLQKQLDRAKLAANPAYIDLEEPDPAEEAKTRRQLDELQAKRREAEARLDRPGNVSLDGKISILQIRTPFRTTDAGRGRKLLDALDELRARALAAHPGVKVGFTGSVVTAVAEHAAIFNGMVMSSLITMVLVGLVLALYFRSATLLVLLISTLTIATTMSFGLAAITVGHLNAATAFLGAIVAGNGINYGIVLIGRYLEERRTREPEAALATAITGTLRPTAVASLGAAIAYGSLAATSFKGFADFALIGAIGMMVCWSASYLLLPALMLLFGRTVRIHTGDPVVGSTLVRVMGFRRSGVVVVVSIALSLVCTVITVRYIAADPFEYDIKQLRSEGQDAVDARAWMQLSDQHFGRGITSRTYIAADQAEQVPKIVAALRALDAGKPADQQTIGTINSVLDVIPEQQAEKLAVLDKLRELVDVAADDLEGKERDDLLALRPPEGLTAITTDRLPPLLRERLAERDPTKIGYLVAVRPANQLDEWNGKDLIRFANAVRELELADGQKITTSGTSVIFADIVDSIESDGPLVTGVAALGLVVMVIILVGPNRRSFAVLVGTAAGTLLMIATCALLGIKVNFLDFVALPITLGLGIDYAINVAHRHDHEEIPDPITTLRTSGSAVFLCSLTTVIGYGSLLVSDNLAIRGFGLAALIGEIACLFTALVLVPAILALGGRRYMPRAAAREAA